VPGRGLWSPQQLLNDSIQPAGLDLPRPSPADPSLAINHQSGGNAPHTIRARDPLIALGAVGVGDGESAHESACVPLVVLTVNPHERNAVGALRLICLGQPWGLCAARNARGGSEVHHHDPAALSGQLEGPTTH